MTDAGQNFAEWNSWLADAVQQDASDVHLVAGYPPVLRVHGALQPLPSEPVPAEMLRTVIESVCPPELLPRFHEKKNLDFAYEAEIAEAVWRFRVNCFIADGSPAACVRVIPRNIPTLKWASFPEATAKQLLSFRNGMVLVTGVTGSGKTTTLAMLVDRLNERGCRIITIEEPVEYRLPRRPQSVVTQREVGQDCATFADGLKYGLRQDPDVILVGEIRDRETAQMALTAAETGHLVLSTLHTRDARGAISRMADLFPQTVQTEVRAQLAVSLRAVVSQHLLPSAPADSKRELALEILFNNNPIASSIRSGNLQSIENYILTCRDEGMRTLSESVRQLFEAGRIAKETAEQFDVG